MIEAIVITAMEICSGSAQYPRCVAWMQRCVITEMTEITERNYHNTIERCAESLPEWAMEGM